LVKHVARRGAALVFLLATACGGAPSEGSIGVVLARDPESRAVFVREIPEPAGPKGDLPDVEPPLLPGDELLMVEGLYVRDLPKDDLRKRLRGPPGSKVKLTVIRGGQVLRLEVVRTPLKAAIGRPREERIEE
jgi:C-terminal processing protease CtpA/Prc